MKKIYLILPLTSLLLSGCPFSRLNQFYEAKIEYYSMVDYINPEKQIYYENPTSIKEHCFKGEMTYKVHRDYPNILFTDFESYFANVALSLPESCHYLVSKNEFVVRDDSDQVIYVAGLDSAGRRLYHSGSIALGTMDIDSSTRLGSLLVDMDLKQEYVCEPYNYGTFVSFEKFSNDLPIYLSRNQIIAPLALFDATFGISLSTNHIFDSKKVVEYNSLSELTLNIGEFGTSAAQTLMNAYHGKQIPRDILLEDKAALYLIMDNYYGLKNFKNINSMSLYLDNLGFNESLLSYDADERSYAYFDLFAALDDDHSGITSIAPWYDDNRAMAHRSQRSMDRKKVSSSLSELRKDTLGTSSTDYGVDERIYYSTSGKTAYFYFDSFIFDKEVYDEANRNELWHSDSYFYFIHQFEEIKAHEGVERVIIDDSLNGGGTIGIASKLLSLISKDNHSLIHFLDNVNEGVSTLEVRVDSNQDGLYDTNDVYGDDFEIAILTSPASFSCGNLFPIMAKRTGSATIIGKNSGGGECSVESTFLPSGRAISFSSNNILCDYDYENNSLVRGFELGANVDKDISYQHFYDINYLEALFD